jgi:hypothetical protein
MGLDTSDAEQVSQRDLSDTVMNPEFP